MHLKALQFENAALLTMFVFKEMCIIFSVIWIIDKSGFKNFLLKMEYSKEILQNKARTTKVQKN